MTKQKYEIARISQKNVADIKTTAWLALSEESQKAYQSDFKLFFAFIKKSAKAVTAEDILLFVKHLEKNEYKIRSINRKLASLSKMFGIMQLSGEIRVNPIQMLKQFKNINYKISPEIKISLTLKDLKKATKITAKTSVQDRKLSVLAKTLAMTGLRISEMLKIKNKEISKFSDEFKKIRIIGKGNKERFIYLDIEIYDEIKSIYPDKNDFIFYTLSGKKYNRTTMYVQIRDFFHKRLGKHVHPHMLRHFYCTYLINVMKMDIKAVSKAVGHSDVSTTLSFYVDTALTPEQGNIKI